MITVSMYLHMKFRELLVWARIPQLYQRIVVWWEFHSNLRDQLKALRKLIYWRSIAMRNATFGSVMLVATKQIQSREELRDMNHRQIMRAWRAGRLNYLMGNGVNEFGDNTFRQWVKNGGQWHE